MNASDFRKNGVKAFAVFLLVQVLMILWRETSLGMHGFPQFVFSLSAGSVIGGIVVSIAAVLLDTLDEQAGKGMLRVIFWNIVSSQACMYVIGKETALPVATGVMLYLSFAAGRILLWVLIRKKARSCRPEVWAAIVCGCCLAAVLLFLFCGNPILQAVFIHLLLTALLYASLLCGERKRALKYTGVLLCALVFAVFSGYQLGKYGKAAITHEGKTYKVLKTDADFLYCEGEEGTLRIQNTQGTD